MRVGEFSTLEKTFIAVLSSGNRLHVIEDWSKVRKISETDGANFFQMPSSKHLERNP